MSQPDTTPRPQQSAESQTSSIASRLSAREREALLLLAQGHTAKSIAGLVGRTESAVNEHLRSARRKTGVGSSRELARLVAAQEFRSEKIGLAEMVGVSRWVGLSAGTRRPAAPGGPMLMTLAASLLAGALLLHARPGAPDRPFEDPLLTPALTASGPSLSVLHGQVRSEVRDVDWADREEAALAARYGALLNGRARHGPLRVLCGRTLCEVAGALTPASRSFGIDPAMQVLQGPDMARIGRSVGMGFSSITFAYPRGQPAAVLFVAYWTRPGH